jgi:uncharacterized membrane protein
MKSEIAGWLSLIFRFVHVIGAMMGSFMSANMFFHITWNQKKFMASLAAGLPHDSSSCPNKHGSLHAGRCAMVRQPRLCRLPPDRLRPAQAESLGYLRLQPDPNRWIHGDCG